MEIYINEKGIANDDEGNLWYDGRSEGSYSRGMLYPIKDKVTTIHKEQPESKDNPSANKEEK